MELVQQGLIDRGLVVPVNRGDARPPELPADPVMREEPARHEDPALFGPPVEEVIEDLLPQDDGIGNRMRRSWEALSDLCGLL